MTVANRPWLFLNAKRNCMSAVTFRGTLGHSSPCAGPFSWLDWAWKLCHRQISLIVPARFRNSAHTASEHVHFIIASLH